MTAYSDRQPGVRWSSLVLAPAAIAAALLLVTVAVSLTAPAGVRDPAVTISAAAALMVAYLRAPKATLLVFALFMLVHNTLAIWYAPGLEQVDELAIPGLVALAAWRTKPWRKRVFEPIRDGAVVVVIVLGIASSLVNAVPVGVWAVALVLMAKSIAFLHVVLWHEYSETDIRQYLVVTLIVGLALLGLGFLEALMGTGFRQLLGLPVNADARGQLPGISSVLEHPVIFSWFATFATAFLLAYYVVTRRLWMLMLALLFGVGTLLSGRRRAIVGLVVAVFGGAIAHVRRASSLRAASRLWLPVAGAALLVAAVFLPGLTQLAEQTVREWTQPIPVLTDDPDGGYVNANPRLVLYATSLQIAAEHFPLGAGLGRYGSPMSRVVFSPVYEQYGLDRIHGLSPAFDAYVTDTFWPHIAGEIGFVGLVAYAVFLGAIGVALWRATQSVDGSLARAFCLAAWMVFLHALAESVASAMYESPPRIYLAFGAIAVALTLARVRRTSEAAARADART